MLHISCPNCGSTYKVQDEVIDRNCRCSKCDLLFRVNDNIVPERVQQVPTVQVNNTSVPPLQEAKGCDRRKVTNKVLIAIVLALVIGVAASRIIHRDTGSIGSTSQRVTSTSLGHTGAELGVESSGSGQKLPAVKTQEERSSELLASIREMFDALMKVRFYPTGNNQLMEQRRIEGLRTCHENFSYAINTAISNSFQVVNWDVVAHNVEVKNGIAQMQVTLRAVENGGKVGLLIGIFVDEDRKCTEALKSLNTPGLVKVSGTFSARTAEDDEIARSAGGYRVYFKLDGVSQ